MRQPCWRWRYACISRRCCWRCSKAGSVRARKCAISSRSSNATHLSTTRSELPDVRANAHRAHANHGRRAARNRAAHWRKSAVVAGASTLVVDAPEAAVDAPEAAERMSHVKQDDHHPFAPTRWATRGPDRPEGDTPAAWV